jgi:hypothetical protein
MKHVVTLTAFAACLALSGAAFAHSVRAGSGGHASGGAWVEGKDAFAFSKQSVDTTSSSSHYGVRTSTKASSIEIGKVEHGSVVVGGEASAGSHISTGH